MTRRNEPNSFTVNNYNYIIFYWRLLYIDFDLILLNCALIIRKNSITNNKN